MTDAELLYEAGVFPDGSVGLLPADTDRQSLAVARPVPELLPKRFAQSCPAGLTYLASAACDQPLTASIQFWRGFARRYFQSLCRQTSTESSQWTGPQCPDDDTLEEWLREAPPMRGLEYASAESLQRLWSGLDEFTREKAAAAKGGLTRYLHRLHPHWNLIGRVTFHLAENKKNPDQPFAFLATYTQAGTDPTGSVDSIQHVPLSVALRKSLAERNSAQLDVLLEPVARAAKSCPLVDELLESRSMFTPQAWGIGQAHTFLSVVPQIEAAGVNVRVPNWWNASRPPRPQVQVTVGSRGESVLSADGGLNLTVAVAIDGEPLTQQELEQLMAAREGLALLRGKWVQIDQDRLQAALGKWKQLEAQRATGLGFLEGMRMLAGASLDGEAMDEQTRAWTRMKPGPWLQEMLDTLREPSGRIKLDPQRNLKATLRPYQADGVRWLWFATKLGLGVCLADDMGLGKTIQVISLLLQLKAADKKKRRTPSLLIMPTSLLGNWKREAERFAPDLKLMVVHRSHQDTKDIKRIAGNPTKELKGVDVVATTYGLARREKWLADIDWRLVILDEAQAIKNSGAAQTRAIKAIPGQGRIALSGTPVENHLGDLWSLFDFCSPGLLGTARDFKRFVKAKDQAELSRRLSSVRQLIRPYVLRRMKTDSRIVADLPDKMEMRVDCGLTAAQAALYRKVTDELEQSVDLATGIQRRGMVLAALLQLKQICNHPALYLKQAEFTERQSGKLAELRSICEVLIEKQEKLLIFTQFQTMCKPLAGFLGEVFGRRGPVLTGRTGANSRSRLVNEFQAPGGPPFMVISLKAGGTGLNLTAANHVVHFDRWWNPAVEDQATDRAFRIGQKKNVVVHKFVCRGTLEEKIDEMIHSKKAISRELLKGEDEINLTEMSNDQLMSFVSLDLAKAATA